MYNDNNLHQKNRETKKFIIMDRKEFIIIDRKEFIITDNDIIDIIEKKVGDRNIVYKITNTNTSNFS
jgi:hypothetical protein